jgi:glucokinase
MKALSLDMGGTHIGCALVDDRRILATGDLPSESAQGLASLLPSLVRLLRSLLDQAGVATSDCGGVAIGFPGIVDARAGRILSTLKKYEDAMHLDLANWCRTEFSLPMRMENDARMALLGETYAGAAQGDTDVVMMTLGTGIGGAAMMQGKLLRGAHSQAGSLGGHLVADFEGRQCTCGNIGCAEAEAAGWSMPRIARDWPGFSDSSLPHSGEIDFLTLFQHAERGDRVATAVRDRCLHVWAANAVSQVHAYDPAVVVLGGGVMKSANVIQPFVQQYVHRHAWAAWGKPAVRTAMLGNDAAFLGAVPLLSEDF